MMYRSGRIKQKLTRLAFSLNGGSEAITKLSCSLYLKLCATICTEIFNDTFSEKRFSISYFLFINIVMKCYPILSVKTRKQGCESI